MITRQTAAQVRELMKLACWPVAIILIVLGRTDDALLVAAFGEITSGAISRISK